MNPVEPENKDQPGMKWYVIRTEPQADYLAAEELERAGFETFFPRIKRVSPKKGPADGPLFPGYLFLRWDLEAEGKPSLRRAPHVSGWVSFDGVVIPVPDEAIAELADRVEAVNMNGGLWRRFKPGDQVYVASKTIQGLAQVVEEGKSPQARVRVLMEFMGGLVPAQVPREDLQPVAEEPGSNFRSARRTRGQGRWIRGFGPRGVLSA